MPVNLNGMDPRVLSALRKIQEQARARGIETNVISGVRSLEDQKQLYANWMAGQRGEPLPFPERGAVPLAAVPGTSQHERGDAFDLQATDPSRQNELLSLAPSVGLRTLGAKDPNHFELASGVQPSRPATGMSTPRSDFLTALQHFESGGKNINNVTQGTSSGQAQGFNQITTGTWNDFGGLKYAANPQAATREQQNEIASSIPLKRWAPETLNYLRGQGFKLDPNATLGENIAANGGTTASGNAIASAASTDDWRSLLGVPNDPGDISLGSMMSDAVTSTSASRATPAPSMQIDDSEPQIDQSFAPASTPVEELGARYAQGKATRKLSPLGQLFSLPTIGLQQVKPAAGPPPYTNLGVG